jgi:short-subunit dehydrogenase
LIINTSGLASIAPFPYVGVLGASKLFGDFLVEPLNYELKEYGIEMTAVRPVSVITNLTRDHLAKDDKVSCTPEQCVQGACSKVTSGI